MWKCENCETINEGEVCAICGEKKPETPTSAPIQQQQSGQQAQQRVVPPVPEKPHMVYVEPPKKSSDNKVLIGVLLTVIITLVVAIAALAVYLITNENDENDNNDLVSVTETINIEDDEAEETPTPSPTPSPTLRPASTPNPTFSKSDFIYGQSKNAFNLNPTYTRITSDAYSWYCDVPTNFEQYVFGVDPYFKAKDGTAIMKIESRSNVYNDTLEEVRSDYLNSMNAVDQLKQKGDDWFAVSFVVDGIAYYKKCYVDHYIRSFEISFPEEYLHMGVYNDYIEHIEDNFRRTDV